MTDGWIDVAGTCVQTAVACVGLSFVFLVLEPARPSE